MNNSALETNHYKKKHFLRKKNFDLSVEKQVSFEFVSG